MATLEALSRDVHHAARRLWQSPGFSLAAVATLALGIGANTAIFSLIKTVMLQPLPYGHAEALVMVWNATNPIEPTHLSLREIVSYGKMHRASRSWHLHGHEREPDRR